MTSATDPRATVQAPGSKPMFRVAFGLWAYVAPPYQSSGWRGAAFKGHWRQWQWACEGTQYQIDKFIRLLCCQRHETRAALRPEALDRDGS